MRPWGGIDRGKELGKHVNTSRIHDKGTTCIVKKLYWEQRNPFYRVGTFSLILSVQTNNKYKPKLSIKNFSLGISFPKRNLKERPFTKL